MNLDSPKWIRPAATSDVWGSSSHLKVPQVQLMRPEILWVACLALWVASLALRFSRSCGSLIVNVRVCIVCNKVCGCNKRV